MYRFEPELKDYIQFLSDKLANKLKPQTTAKPVTGIQLCYGNMTWLIHFVAVLGIKPFNLTNPKPRTLPTPEKV